ncbi:MAG: extracellular solute-binding protein [Lachnospiraceae bacterium]|nr:extracellular solute-binding protein [Lachnospiraceae bacterium]
MNITRKFLPGCFLLLTLLLTGCGQEPAASVNDPTAQTTQTYATSTQVPEAADSEDFSFGNLFSQEEDIPRHEDGRAIVTLSIFYASSEIETAVVAFNESNSEYYVELLTAEEGTTAGDYWERELVEISTGKGPDLFTKTLQTSFLTYIQKGVIEDLTPYIERDLQKEDYVESSLYAYARDGKVYAIESGFSVVFPAGSEDILGNRTGWNFTEMQEIMESQPQLQIFESTYGSNVGDFLRDYLCYGGNDYTDYDTLRECLAFDKAYGKGLPDDIPAIPGDNVLVEQIIMDDALDWADYEALYARRLTPIGFVSDRESGILHEGFGWSINAASKQKEGAWAFLRFLLSEEYQRKYVQNFSPLKELLEEQLRFYSTPLTYTFYDEKTKQEYTYTTGHTLPRTTSATEVTPAYVAEHGTASIVIDCMSAEQLETVRRLIDNSRTACFDWDATAQNIIFEEAEYYFNDERSLDEVMSIIENRMNIYLAEQN